MHSCFGETWRRVAATAVARARAPSKPGLRWTNFVYYATKDVTAPAEYVAGAYIRNEEIRGLLREQTLAS